MKRGESVKKAKFQSRSWVKKQQRQAERTARKQQLKKDPLDLDKQEKRRLYGWSD